MNRVVIVDQQELTGAALSALLENAGHDVRVGADAALEPEALVVVVHEEEAQGDTALGRTVRTAQAPVLALVPSANVHAAMEAFDAGATGVASTSDSPAYVSAAVAIVAAGGTVLATCAAQELRHRAVPLLSDEECDWLRSIAAGRTVAALAVRSCRSERTMYRQLREVYDKLAVSGKSEAIIEARRRGLL